LQLSITGTHASKGDSTMHIQGGPKKVNHYQELSLNGIENRQCGYI